MVSSSTDMYKGQFLVNVSFSSVDLFDQWLSICMKYKKGLFEHPSCTGCDLFLLGKYLIGVMFFQVT